MRARKLAAGLFAALLPMTCLAIPITYEFSGAFNQSDNTVPTQFPEPLLPFGTVFHGYFTIETSTPTSFENGNVFSYNASILEGDISIGENGSLGNNFYVPNPVRPNASYSSNITIINDLEFAGNPPYDQLNLQFTLNPLWDDPLFSIRTFSISANDYAAMLFPPGHTLADGLPVDNILAGSHQLSFGIAQYDANGQNIDDSSVTSTTFTMRQFSPPIQSVPEPGSWALMGTAMVGLLISRRRRILPARR